MGASTRSRVLSALPVVGGALLIAALTALVFLIRAGGDPADAATWPITWELRSSDNGPLFQLLQDVVAGRPLDWTFSPQVFVFPELPISALAFLIAGGSIGGYYLVVALLNNTLLFLVLTGLVRTLYPDAANAVAVLRAGIAATPLLVLPLIGTSWIFTFHLAPTYYFGMYAALLAAPLLVLGRSRAVRLTVAVLLALTAASNPLALLFAAPGTAAVLVLRAVRSGWRSTSRAVLLVGGTLVLALLLRLLFSPLQGTSPFTYVDPEVFATRLSQIGPYYAYQELDPAAGLLIPAGRVLAVLCFVAAVAASVVSLRRSTPADGRLLVVVYLGLVPLGGLGATYLMMITHYLYFWPVLILPFVLLLLSPFRRRALPGVAAACAVLLGGVAVVTGGVTTLPSAAGFWGYRSAETVCIDAAVPPGSVGYATFSDARRLSLPSAAPFRLIQIEADGTPSTWLTNRAYARTDTGTFFYVNGRGDELPIEVDTMTARYGTPDRVVTCADAQAVYLYDDPAKIARITAFYDAEH